MSSRNQSTGHPMNDSMDQSSPPGAYATRVRAYLPVYYALTLKNLPLGFLWRKSETSPTTNDRPRKKAEWHASPELLLLCKVQVPERFNSNNAELWCETSLTRTSNAIANTHNINTRTDSEQAIPSVSLWMMSPTSHREDNALGSCLQENKNIDCSSHVNLTSGEQPWRDYFSQSMHFVHAPKHRCIGPVHVQDRAPPSLRTCNWDSAHREVQRASNVHLVRKPHGSVMPY